MVTKRVPNHESMGPQRFQHSERKERKRKKEKERKEEIEIEET